MKIFTQVQGIGQTQNPEQGNNVLSWRDGKGHEGTFWPYIDPHLPVHLESEYYSPNMYISPI